MNLNEVNQFWHYFCTLSSELDNTRRYVDHQYALDENNPISKTYSIEFLKLIMATGAEFESICKVLIHQKIPTFDMDSNGNNIVTLTKNILTLYPKIVETEIQTPYKTIKSLNLWSINSDNEVLGLGWWKIYNSVKHNRSENYESANLINVIKSMSSLMILNLYLVFSECHDMCETTNYPCNYFASGYSNQYFVTQPDALLPDFK